jgi:hypothetical protein
MHSEQCAAVCIQVNGIIANAGSFQEPGQFRPDLIVPFTVLGFKAGLDMHRKCAPQHH